MFLRIVTKQAKYRWPITLLLWAAMTALVSLYVYLGNSARFSNRSMQLIMKNLGHNLLILPRSADPLDTYLCSPNQVLFAEDVTARMAAHTRLASKYYTSVLQQRVALRGRPAILTGMAPVHRADETAEKAHLDSAIPPGSARLGAAAAEALGATVGDRFDVLGKTYRVADVLPPVGSMDDHRVYVPLAEGQQMLGQPGRINAILAFLCLHGTTLEGISAYQQREFAKLFPDFRIITKTRIAQGRYLARMTTDRYLAYLLAVVLCITVVMIVVTGLQEVAERRREVGVLLAMGTSYVYIIGLYVAKVAAIALAAAVTGFFIGSWLSAWLLSPVLVTRTRPVALVWAQLPEVLGLTCLVALAAAVLPMAKLVRLDPNVILAEE